MASTVGSATSGAGNAGQSQRSDVSSFASHGIALRRWFLSLTTEERLRALCLEDKGTVQTILEMHRVQQLRGPCIFYAVGDSADMSERMLGRLSELQRRASQRAPHNKRLPLLMNALLGQRLQQRERSSSASGNSSPLLRDQGSLAVSGTSDFSPTRPSSARSRASRLSRPSPRHRRTSSAPTSPGIAFTGEEVGDMALEDYMDLCGVGAASRAHCHTHLHRHGHHSRSHGGSLDAVDNSFTTLGPNLSEASSLELVAGTAGSSPALSGANAAYGSSWGFPDSTAVLKPSRAQDFCHQRLDAISAPFIQLQIPEVIQRMDGILESSVRLCDTRGYCDTLTVCSDILVTDAEKAVLGTQCSSFSPSEDLFLYAMRIVTRGNFLSEPCRALWDPAKKQWRWQGPAWFERLGFYSLATYIAHKLEIVLWKAYWERNHLDPRVAGCGKTYIWDSNSKAAEMLSSTMPLFRFWESLTAERRTQILNKLKALIMLVRTSDWDKRKSALRHLHAQMGHATSWQLVNSASSETISLPSALSSRIAPVLPRALSGSASPSASMAMALNRLRKGKRFGLSQTGPAALLEAFQDRFRSSSQSGMDTHRSSPGASPFASGYVSSAEMLELLEAGDHVSRLSNTISSVGLDHQSKLLDYQNGLTLLLNLLRSMQEDERKQTHNAVRNNTALAGAATRAPAVIRRRVSHAPFPLNSSQSECQPSMDSQSGDRNGTTCTPARASLFQNHLTETAPNPVRRSRDTFIEFLYFSPLARAGTALDIVIRELGMCVRKSFAEQIGMDLILGEEAELASSQSQASKKSKKRPKKRKTKTKFSSPSVEKESDSITEPDRHSLMDYDSSDGASSDGLLALSPSGETPASTLVSPLSPMVAQRQYSDSAGHSNVSGPSFSDARSKITPLSLNAVLSATEPSPDVLTRKRSASKESSKAGGGKSSDISGNISQLSKRRSMSPPTRASTNSKNSGSNTGVSGSKEAPNLSKPSAAQRLNAPSSEPKLPHGSPPHTPAADTNTLLDKPRADLKTQLIRASAHVDHLPHKPSLNVSQNAPVPTSNAPRSLKPTRPPLIFQPTLVDSTLKTNAMPSPSHESALSPRSAVQDSIGIVTPLPVSTTISANVPLESYPPPVSMVSEDPTVVGVSSTHSPPLIPADATAVTRNPKGILSLKAVSPSAAGRTDASASRMNSASNSGKKLTYAEILSNMRNLQAPSRQAKDDVSAENLSSSGRSSRDSARSTSEHRGRSLTPPSRAIAEGRSDVKAVASLANKPADIWAALRPKLLVDTANSGEALNSRVPPSAETKLSLVPSAPRSSASPTKNSANMQAAPPATFSSLGAGAKTTAISSPAKGRNGDPLFSLAGFDRVEDATNQPSESSSSHEFVKDEMAVSTRTFSTSSDHRSTRDGEVPTPTPSETTDLDRSFSGISTSVLDSLRGSVASEPSHKLGRTLSDVGRDQLQQVTERDIATKRKHGRASKVTVSTPNTPFPSPSRTPLTDHSSGEIEESLDDSILYSGSRGSEAGAYAVLPSVVPSLEVGSSLPGTSGPIDREAERHGLPLPDLQLGLSHAWKSSAQAESRGGTHFLRKSDASIAPGQSDPAIPLHLARSNSFNGSLNALMVDQSKSRRSTFDDTALPSTGSTSNTAATAGDVIPRGFSPHRASTVRNVHATTPDGILLPPSRASGSGAMSGRQSTSGDKQGSVRSWSAYPTDSAAPTVGPLSIKSSNAMITTELSSGLISSTPPTATRPLGKLHGLAREHPQRSLQVDTGPSAMTQAPTLPGLPFNDHHSLPSHSSFSGSARNGPSPHAQLATVAPLIPYTQNPVGPSPMNPALPFPLAYTMLPPWLATSTGHATPAPVSMSTGRTIVPVNGGAVRDSPDDTIFMTRRAREERGENTVVRAGRIDRFQNADLKSRHQQNAARTGHMHATFGVQPHSPPTLSPDPNSVMDPSHIWTPARTPESLIISSPVLVSENAAESKVSNTVAAIDSSVSSQHPVESLRRRSGTDRDMNGTRSIPPPPGTMAAAPTSFDGISRPSVLPSLLAAPSGFGSPAIQPMLPLPLEPKPLPLGIPVAIALDKEIGLFSQWMTQRSVQRSPFVHYVLNLIRECARTVLGHHRVEIESYGSFATGLALPTSDLDLVARVIYQAESKMPSSTLASGSSVRATDGSSLFREDVGPAALTTTDGTSGTLSQPLRKGTTQSVTNSSFPGISSSRSLEVQALQKLSGELAQQPWVSQLKAIETARIPIIKFVATVHESDTGELQVSGLSQRLHTNKQHSPVLRSQQIHVDISFDCLLAENVNGESSGGTSEIALRGTSSHTGLRAVGVVRAFIAAYPALAPLALVLKEFLRQRGLNSTYTAGISSHCLVLMIASYLRDIQVHGGRAEIPPLDPQLPRKERRTKLDEASKMSYSSPDLGHLLLGFLEFFTCKFDFRLMGIDPGPPPPALWPSNVQVHVTQPPPPGVSASSVSSIASAPSPQKGCFYWLDSPSQTLVLLDPLDRSTNIGAGIFAMWRIKSAFEYAYGFLRAPRAFAPTLLSRILEAPEHRSVQFLSPGAVPPSLSLPASPAQTTIRAHGAGNHLRASTASNQDDAGDGHYQQLPQSRLTS